jgi:hypothetical protein
MKICTKAKAAQLLHVSRATIYAMIERGELVPNELGYVDLDQLPAHTDFSKPGRKRKGKNAGGTCEAEIDTNPTQVQDTLDALCSMEEDLEQTIKAVVEGDAEKTKSQFDKEKIAVPRVLDLLERCLELVKNDRKIIDQLREEMRRHSKIYSEGLTQVQDVYQQTYTLLSNLSKILPPLESLQCPHCGHQIVQLETEASSK